MDHFLWHIIIYQGWAVLVRGSCWIRTNWHFHETTEALPLLHNNKVDDNNADDNDGDQDCGDYNDDQD